MPVPALVWQAAQNRRRFRDCPLRWLQHPERRSLARRPPSTIGSVCAPSGRCHPPSICAVRKRSRTTMQVLGNHAEVWFARDSPLEGTGFEPSVPRQEKWSMPSSSDQTRVGRTLTLGGGAESSLEGRDIELSVSPKDIRTSPYDLCANRSDRRQSREGDRWFESTSLQR